MENQFGCIVWLNSVSPFGPFGLRGSQKKEDNPLAFPDRTFPISETLGPGNGEQSNRWLNESTRAAWSSAHLSTNDENSAHSLQSQVLKSASKQCSSSLIYTPQNALSPRRRSRECPLGAGEESCWECRLEELCVSFLVKMETQKSLRRTTLSLPVWYTGLQGLVGYRVIYQTGISFEGRDYTTGMGSSTVPRRSTMLFGK